VLALQHLALRPHADIEAGECRRHRHVAIAKLRAQRAADVERGRQRRFQDRAAVDVQQRVAARFHEARGHGLLGPPHMQAHPAAALAMRIGAGRNVM
jgi:hypothetical protein